MNRVRNLIASLVFLCAAPALGQTDYGRFRSDEWSNRTAMPGIVWGSKVAIEDRACCEADKRTSVDTESAIAPGRTARIGPTLVLKLDGEKSLKITDCRDTQKCGADFYAVHRLAAWWSELGYYVVSVGGHEDSAAFLIRENDGLVIRVAAVPTLSPDKNYAIAWDSSIANGGPKMELLDMKSKPPRIYDITSDIACPNHSESAHPGPHPKWESNKLIGFDNSDFIAANSPHFMMTLTILPRLNLLWRCQV